MCVQNGRRGFRWSILIRYGVRYGYVGFRKSKPCLRDCVWCFVFSFSDQSGRPTSEICIYIYIYTSSRVRVDSATSLFCSVCQIVVNMRVEVSFVECVEQNKYNMLDRSAHQAAICICHNICIGFACKQPRPVINRISL